MEGIRINESEKKNNRKLEIYRAVKTLYHEKR